MKTNIVGLKVCSKKVEELKGGDILCIGSIDANSYDAFKVLKVVVNHRTNIVQVFYVLTEDDAVGFNFRKTMEVFVLILNQTS